MIETTMVRCPQCGAKLKITKPSLIGKDGICPKCKHQFIFTAMNAPDSPNFEGNGLVPASTQSSKTTEKRILKVESVTGKAATMVSTPDSTVAKTSNTSATRGKRA